MTGDRLAEFVKRIGAESFAEWYREREWARNIQNGQPYFNGPSRVPPVERHSPSGLLQCHRKIYYRQENAPAERETPEGIFWTGNRFEEDVIVPYLREAVVGDDTYVRNSLWIDFEVATRAGDLRFKGVTDPCIVDRMGEPLLPTEEKTKEEVAHLDGPNRHHRAQVHAYMRGLSEKYDREITEAVIIYGARKTMNVRVFHEEFDEDFWEDAVVEWAADHTAYRAADELPLADPEYDWECGFCDYRHRCGQSDEPYSDEGSRGLLPGFADYPRERVVEYLRAHEDAKLTPTLGREYPDLADEYATRKWSCASCGTDFAWDSSQVNDEGKNQPVCPECASMGDLAVLRLV